MDKLSQLRQMREQASRRHMMPASPDGDLEAIADANDFHGNIGTRDTRGSKRKRSTAVRPVETRQSNEGKPAMTEAAPQVWSKGLYQNLYMKRQRAKTPDERAAAETALREAFPKTRPRKVKAALPKVAVPKKKKSARKKVKAKPVKAKAKPVARKKQAKKKKGHK